MKKPKFYDSMKATSAAIDMSMRALKEAKNSGCPAFRGGRVYVDELLQWWSDEFAKEGLKIPTTQVIQLISILDTELGIN